MSTSGSANTLDSLPVFDHHHGRPEVWSGLSIDGLVQNPAVLAESDLANLTARTLTDDFRCEEGWSVPDLEWAGVPLSALLDIVNPLPGARFAAVSAADFTVAIPLDSDLSTVLLATRLNGATLTADHGGPCRLVSQGQACYASVKWVDSIRLTAEPPAETAAAIARARNAEQGPTTP